MAQNIVVIIMVVIVAAAGIWCWWIENGKDSTKDEKNEKTDGNAEEKQV